MAPSWAEMAPLSSAEPRAKSRPSRRVSFHGSRLPLLDEVDRLHVVVGVEEDGRLAGRVEPLAVGVGERVARREATSTLCRPALPHLLAGELRGAVDLGVVLAVGADALDGDQVGQAADDLFVIACSASRIPLALHSSPHRRAFGVPSL